HRRRSADRTAPDRYGLVPRAEAEVDAHAHERRQVVPDEGLPHVRRRRSGKQGAVTMAGFLGIQEIVLLIVLFGIIFGAKRLPELGRSLGRGMREFRNGVTGKD